MHVGNKTEEGSFQFYRIAMGKNSAVSYYKYSPHIQQGEKTKSEKRREIEDVKKIPVDLLELKDTALETKKILDEIKVD